MFHNEPGYFVLAMQEVQPNAFLLADLYLNSPLPCATLPRLDLSRWEAVQRPQVTSSSSKAEDREEEESLEAIR